jgi:hypothetical protein
MCRNCGFNDDYVESADVDFSDDEDDFDYDDFIAREFPQSADPDSDVMRRRAWTRLVVVLIAVSFGMAMFLL